MSVFPRVIFDESHSQAWTLDPMTATKLNPAQPADACYSVAAEELRQRGFEIFAHHEGPLAEAARPGDVIVIAHPASTTTERSSGTGSPEFSAAEIDALENFVRGGGGLVVLGECNQESYGTNLNELLRRFGVSIDNITVHDGIHRYNDVSAWVLGQLGIGQGQGLLAGVREMCFYRSGAITLSPELADIARRVERGEVVEPLRGSGTRQDTATVIARTSADAHPSQAPLAVAITAGAGRLVVFADSDLFGDDSIHELSHRRLWSNIVTWAAGAGTGGVPTVAGSHLRTDPRWTSLKKAVETVREWQVKDGSVDASLVPGGDLSVAQQQVDHIIAGIEALAPEFPHDAEFLAALVTDFRSWKDAGLSTPDFHDSLDAFHPDAHRVDEALHLVVFPMYTQNGNPNKQLEAVLFNVLWPQWLADIEEKFINPAFLSINFIDFTPGYDTNSAVLFPETVAARPIPTFTWGAIFSDREAARFRAVVAAAASTLRLQLPPDAERLVTNQELCQNVFAMWDLIHDRTHSHGDLPFDPFMIKQRMPFWLYSLEELRCDLNTFVHCIDLEQQGQPYAKAVQYAVIFDRIFRFSITGGRVRNYDGLGGQLLFSYLHKHDALRWTDNTLTFDWARTPQVVKQLCDEVNDLYRTGIDRSKFAHWLATHQYISQYVPPHPSSVWAKGAEALPLDGEPKELVNCVRDDEFPLNVFFEALAKKIGHVIEGTRGVTGESDVEAIVQGRALAHA